MLTDEQIDTVTDAQWGVQAVGGMYLAYRAYARAIEAETLKAHHQQSMEAAVMTEREQCAKLAETIVCDLHIPTGVKIYGTKVAKAIRNQK